MRRFAPHERNETAAIIRIRTRNTQHNVMAENTFVTSAKTFVAKLSNAQKISIAVAIVAAITGISMLVMNSSKPAMAVLFSDLDQKDAATIVDKLKEQGVEYQIGNNGNSIMVNSEKVYETRLSLAKDGFLPGNTVGYELFDKTNLGMSDFVQKLNYKRAIEGELQKTISSFDECQKVRVMIVMPEKTLFEKDQKKPTAAVHLHLKNGRSISKLNVEGIQNLVASSVEGMIPGDVVVIDQRGQILSEAKKDQSALAGLSSTQMEQQQKVDDYMIHKVQSMLDGVLGANKAIVRINTDLDFTQIERTKENYDPDGQVVLSDEKINETHSAKDTIDYPPVNNQSSIGKVRANYLNSKNIEHIVNAVGTVKRISVSVMVDGTNTITEVNGEKQLKYTPRSDDEIQKIKQIVRDAVGFDPQRNDQISVVNMPFDQTALEEEIKEPKNFMDMTPKDIVEKVLLVLAMLIAVFMVRKLFASPQVQRQIREILSPPMENLVANSPYAYQLGNGAASGYTVAPNGQLVANTQQSPAALLEDGSKPPSKDEIIARARARLDSKSLGAMNEDQIIQDEMKHRVQHFFETNETEAMKIVKLMMHKPTK